MGQQVKIECGKCLGKGHIRAFGHVAGGICFTCAGVGFKLVKRAPRPRYWFAVLLHNEEQGWHRTYNFEATSQKTAETHARKKSGNRPHKVVCDFERNGVAGWENIRPAEQLEVAV